MVSVNLKIYGSNLYLFFKFYLPYLSCIHEKANCIAMFWTGRPHSLGSCQFRCVWATGLPHEGGDVSLSALPKDTSELTACSPQPPLITGRQAEKLWIPFFKVFWYDQTRGFNPRFTNCEVDAPTTTPSHQTISCPLSYIPSQVDYVAAISWSSNQ